MDFSIYNANGELVNIIHADEQFTKSYCEKHGYTYAPYPEPGPTVEERLDAVERQVADLGDVWSEMEMAYTEGVNSAYDQ